LSGESFPALASSATPWTADHVVTIRTGNRNTTPLLGASDFARVSDTNDFWDAWPIQEDNGEPAVLANGDVLWMALGAPRFDDPDERHGHARIHLILRTPTAWRDLGPAMPEGFSPGSREWSGSAVLDADHHTLTLYFTATGRRGETQTSFEQRLFKAQATLRDGDTGWQLADWRNLAEIVERDADHYMASDSGTGRVNTIKAFRDPAYFRDPADGRRYLFFAGSLAATTSAYNGVIGAAVAGTDDAKWRILPPLISADTLNNELERPHVVYHGGHYYLFWSTQQHVFDPAGPSGPTGLYGMVAKRLGHDWAPLNGTGLVLANPANAPRQAYSWLVMPDLQVTSFVDDWGTEAAGRTKRFGATFAPMLRLRLDGAHAELAPA
jgi:levansucrase